MITLAATNTLAGKATTATAITYTVYGDEIGTTDTFKVLAQGQLPNSATTLYTVPASTQTLIKEIQLANTTASPVSGIVLYVNGVAAGNQIFAGMTIPANGSASYCEGLFRVFDATGLIISTTTITLTGDITGSGSGTVATTLATVNGNVGTFGSASTVNTITVNAKGLTTAVTNNAIAIANTAVSGLGTASIKNIGNTILDPGTGKLEYAWPVAAAVTGANKTYVGTDRGYVFLRSNSGSAMSDTLPALTNTTADIGWMIAIHNEGTTTTEVLTMNASGGALFRSNSGGTSATSPINYGCRQMFVWSGTQWTLETGNANLLRRTGAIVAGNMPQFLDTAGNVVVDSGISATAVNAKVSGVTATDTSITVTGTATAPTISRAAITGDVTIGAGLNASTVGKINGTSLAGLTTGILKNTTTTGVPSIAVAADIPTTPSGSALGTGRTITTTAPLQIAGTTSADLSVDRTLSILGATSTTPGTLSAAQFNFLSAYNGTGIIFVTANAYSNLLVDGSTDDLAALNTLMANAPDGSILVWPGQNKTMVLSGAAAIPSGKHFCFVGGGPGGKTHVLQTSLTADHFTVQDWYSTFTGFDFMTNNTTTTAVQAYTSGTVLTVVGITTALIPASGSINVGSATGWQVLTYSARTSTTITLSSTGTGSSAIGDVVVFKTAGAAITAGNNVGIDVYDNSFTCCFNGYTASGSTSNQSTIESNGFLNTINFDIMIDAANWNGIIDSNTCDCTVRSRSLSHCEILQCGSITGTGNQFIRGQFNLRLGSTTAAYPAGVFGVYFTNTFFDNAGTDAVKVQGISAVQRVKLTSCWLSSAAANGLNFASTASTLPTDIELIGCNIYSNTTAGINGAGVADYKITGGQIAGNGTGFLITPATGNVYSVHAVGVRVGPTGGIGVNTTGLNIATGTYAQLKFADCDFTGNTTVLTLGTITPVTGSRYAITGCPGINPRGSALVQPGVPTSTTVLTNTTGFRCTIFLKNGSTSPTVITVNGQAVTGFTTATVSAAAGQIFLDPGGTIAMTYTVAPTWVWIAN